MNEENLKPFTSDQSREEAAKNGQKGGIASGVAKREKKMLRDTLNYLLELRMKNKRGEPVLNPLDNSPMTYETAGMVKLATKYANGDLDAIKLVQSIKGEEQKNIKLDGDLKTEIDVSGLSDADLFAMADKLQGIQKPE